MASSSSVPASLAKVSSSSSSSSSLVSNRRHARVSFHLSSNPKKLLLFPSKGLRFYWNRSSATNARLNEVVGGSLNDTAPAETKPDVLASKLKDVESDKEPSPSAPMTEEAISEFLTQAASLVKLVDSRDIVELQLKQLNCELIIRKREALPQPPAPAPVVMMQPPSLGAAMPSQFAPPPPAGSFPSVTGASASSAPLAMTPSAPKSTKSSHPPLKSPMAGTFYRNPGPGLPPFVKVGDKVNKGQVLCIIEAMKLMNEIEADHAGTVVEVLVDDSKPVSFDQPLFVIEP